MNQMHIALLRKWCHEVPGALETLGLLALCETGMYEHELIEMLQVQNFNGILTVRTV